MCNECENCKRLRAIIEQDNVEPVAWQLRGNIGSGFYTDYDEAVKWQALDGIRGKVELIPVYLHPPKASTEPRVPFCWTRTCRDITDEYYQEFSEDNIQPQGTGWKALYDEPEPASKDSVKRDAECKHNGNKETGYDEVTCKQCGCD